MRYLILSIFLAIMPQAFGGDTIGDISLLGVNRFDQALVKAGDMNQLTGCAAQFKRYVVDLTTDHGRAMYSLMASAQAQSRQIRIVGKEVCDIRPDAESIQLIEIVL